MPEDYAKIAKDKDVESLISSMTVDSDDINYKDFANKHNILTGHAITWLAILRQRHHDFDGLLHSVKNMVGIISDSHDELKKEHAMTREATGNNTAALNKLHTIAETSLWWIKVFGGVSTLALIFGMGAAIVKWVIQ